MSVDSEGLFILFLQIAGIPQERIKIHVKEFKEFNATMEEFSKAYILNECETLFLQRMLVRLSKVYDVPNLRKRIASVVGKSVPGVKGDLHVHTDWSDGTYPLELYVKKAEEMGYEYLAITDHSLVGKGAVQMDSDKFLKQIEYINEIQRKTQVKIIKGVEMDINENGRLDYPKEVLEKADFVLGAVHFDYGKGKERAVELLELLLKNEYVSVIAHPLNKIGKRTFDDHLEEIVKLAKENRKTLEISLVPDRIEESDFIVEKLKDSGVKFSFGTDSHSVKQLELMSLSNLWLDKMDMRSIANFHADPLKFMEE